MQTESRAGNTQRFQTLALLREFIFQVDKALLELLDQLFRIPGLRGNDLSNELIAQFTWCMNRASNDRPGGVRLDYGLNPDFVRLLMAYLVGQASTASRCPERMPSGHTLHFSPENLPAWLDQMLEFLADRFKYTTEIGRLEQEVKSSGCLESTCLESEIESLIATAKQSFSNLDSGFIRMLLELFSQSQSAES
jgi:chorismate mutase